MNRRDAISAVSLLIGGTVIGAELFLSGCKQHDTEHVLGMNEANFLDEVGETILPKTPALPGAKDVHIGSFMVSMVNDCYGSTDQEIFKDGLKKLDKASKDKYDKSFIALPDADKHALLLLIDAEAHTYHKNNPGKPLHYYTMMKQLTLLGYFTSEPGATQALRHVSVPGRFEGCIPYEKGDRAFLSAG
jgi:Gluconate 2-dehydrogenase subunit 3